MYVLERRRAVEELEAEHPARVARHGARIVCVVVAARKTREVRALEARLAHVREVERARTDLGESHDLDEHRLPAYSFV